MTNIDIDVEEEVIPLRKRHSLRCEIDELPEKFRNKIMEMRGTEETLIFKRTLAETDVNKGISRLSIPLSKLLSYNFLTSDDEKETIETRIEGGRKGSISVKVIDPRLEVWELKFTRYDMEKKTKKGTRGKTSSLYVLGYKWNHVVRANSLRQGDDLELWSFRSQQKLCFALVLLEGEERLLGN